MNSDKPACLNDLVFMFSQAVGLGGPISGMLCGPFLALAASRVLDSQRRRIFGGGRKPRRTSTLDFRRMTLREAIRMWTVPDVARPAPPKPAPIETPSVGTTTMGEEVHDYLAHKLLPPGMRGLN